MRTLFSAILAITSLAASAATTITHKPVDYYFAEKRIRLEAKVADPQGVKLARAYFKTSAQADFLFVPMQAQLTASGTYVAVLPAPARSAATLSYVLLAVNGAGEVSKTVVYTANRRDQGEVPSWQMLRSEGQLQVFTEIPNAPSAASAFSDSISMDLAESGARFGAVAGLYGAQAGAAGGGSSTAATTSAAPALGTAAIVGGVALAAGVAVAAAAGSGGGSGGGGGGSGGSTTYQGSIAQCAVSGSICACAGSTHTNDTIPSSFPRVGSGGTCSNGSTGVAACPVGLYCVSVYSASTGLFSSSACGTPPGTCTYTN